MAAGAKLAIFLPFVAMQAAMFQGDGQFRLEHSQDSFGIRSHGVVQTLGANREKFYPLPQSTSREYMRLRPEDLRLNPFKPEDYDRQEVIGPYQFEGSKIWFGNNYYDGEGMRGVGAFGYFDQSTRRYTLFSPPEVARYEVSAILVESKAVWVALDHFGEDICTSPGGLIRWDRTTHEVQRYPLEFVVNRIRMEGGSLRLQTHDGYALLQDGKLDRFLNNGRPINRFPPPSKY